MTFHKPPWQSASQTPVLILGGGEPTDSDIAMRPPAAAVAAMTPPSRPSATAVTEEASSLIAIPVLQEAPTGGGGTGGTGGAAAPWLSSEGMDVDDEAHDDLSHAAGGGGGGGQMVLPGSMALQNVDIQRGKRLKHMLQVTGLLGPSVWVDLREGHYGGWQWPECPGVWYA